MALNGGCLGGAFRIGKVRRVFRWAVENEVIPVAIYQALRAVATSAL